MFSRENPFVDEIRSESSVAIVPGSEGAHAPNFIDNLTVYEDSK